jgi:ABC-2 type transport system permease protein
VERLDAAGLSPQLVQVVLAAPTADVQRVGDDRDSRRGAAVVVSLVMYLLLLVLMIMVANGVAIEKANRISEVLLAVVRPPALLFGKVLGVAFIGLVTLLCGLAPVVVKLALGGDPPTGSPPRRRHRRPGSWWARRCT